MRNKGPLVVVATKAAMVQVLGTLETMKPGDAMTGTILCDGRLVELETPWPAQ
jgi:hypothetical protein